MGIDSPVKRLTRGVERKTSNSVEGRGFTLGVLEALIHEAEVGCVVEGLVPILLPETQRGKGEPDQNPKRAKAPGSRRSSGEARRSSRAYGSATQKLKLSDMVSATLLVRLLSCFSTADSGGAGGTGGSGLCWPRATPARRRRRKPRS